MNTHLKRISCGLLLLVGVLAAGYGLQALVYAQDSQKGEDAPEKPKAEMQMMCPMMTALKGVELYADTPALLTAQAEKLKLTDEQKKQLKEIAKSAQEEARKVLTAEQRQALEKLPQGPLSMMQIAKMQMKDKKDGGDEKMMCPMCMKMMQKKSEEGQDK